MAVGLTTGQAAAVLGLSPSTLRAWERRLPGMCLPERTRGQHRRYERTFVLGLRDALQEGLSGPPMIERARELQASGRYSTPTLLERFDRLEAAIAGTNAELRAIRAGMAEALRRLR